MFFGVTQRIRWRPVADALRSTELLCPNSLNDRFAKVKTSITKTATGLTTESKIWNCGSHRNQLVKDQPIC